ncbi:MAG: hypothetical protein HWE16_13540 [Gammaproteobacteria bacterium]|nr:hypothetical protein [Gammaproteobacteria bacterium]
MIVSKLSIPLVIATIVTMVFFNTAKGNEDKRAAMLQIIEQQIGIHRNMGSNTQVENLQSAKNQLLQLSFEELQALPETPLLNNFKSVNDKLLLETQNMLSNKTAPNFSLKATTTLTQPDYADFPLCGTAPGERYDDIAVFASEQALFVAETVREVASRACEQVAVAAGFGGNTSAACLISDAVYIAAKEAHNILSFCDAEVDEAQLETTFLRTEDLFNLGHEISDELAAHDSAIASLLGTHDSDIKDAINQHDIDIKSDIFQHDSDLKAALSQHDTEVKELLNLVLGGQAQILANQAEIIELLKTPSGRRDGWNKQP